MGALETKLNTDKGPQFATIAEIVQRSKFYRDGQQVEVLREVTPEVVRLTPSLVYLLRTSLGGLGEGLRLLPLSNVDAQGNPVLTGHTPGELRIEYRFDEKSARSVRVLARAADLDRRHQEVSEGRRAARGELPPTAPGTASPLPDG